MDNKGIKEVFMKAKKVWFKGEHNFNNSLNLRKHQYRIVIFLQSRKPADELLIATIQNSLGCTL